MRSRFQITQYCHNFMKDYIHEGDVCIDATTGNGNDTEFLCRLVGEKGHVYGFDIQEEAIRSTKERLEKAGLGSTVTLYQTGHQHMKEYVKEEAAAIMFNFGYLPGGDHQVSTRAETSIQAVQQGLELLKTGGVMNLCIYSGKDTGYEEKDALLSYLKELDSKKWLVIVNSYFNRKNDPPIPVFIIKLEK